MPKEKAADKKWLFHKRRKRNTSLHRRQKWPRAAQCSRRREAPLAGYKRIPCQDAGEYFLRNQPQSSGLSWGRAVYDDFKIFLRFYITCCGSPFSSVMFAKTVCNSPYGYCIWQNLRVGNGTSRRRCCALLDTRATLTDAFRHPNTKIYWRAQGSGTLTVPAELASSLLPAQTL